MKKVVSRIETRDLSPFFKWCRERMAGRKVTPDHLRFEADVSDRTQPDPCLPDGPSHKLFGNYYFMRDSRCLVSRPLLIAGPDEIKRLGAGESKEKQISFRSTGITPGAIYNPSAELKRPIRDPAKLVKLKAQNAEK